MTCLKTQLPGQHVDFALVLEDGLAHRARPALLVVGGLDQIGRVAFGDELGDEASAEEGNIIRMGLDGGQHLALVGLVWGVLFDGYFADGGVPGNARVGTRGHGRFLFVVVDGYSDRNMKRGNLIRYVADP